MASQILKRFVDWEEQFVSHDRGSRVVHYYLRDRHGQNSLAVVGTERSLRHMVYVVCDEFLPLAGLDKSTTSAFKWRARREVVEWLQSLLTKTRPGSSEQYHSSGGCSLSMRLVFPCPISAATLLFLPWAYGVLSPHCFCGCSDKLHVGV